MRAGQSPLPGTMRRETGSGFCRARKVPFRRRSDRASTKRRENQKTSIDFHLRQIHEHDHHQDAEENRGHGCAMPVHSLGREPRAGRKIASGGGAVRGSAGQLREVTSSTAMDKFVEPVFFDQSRNLRSGERTALLAFAIVTLRQVAERLPKRVPNPARDQLEPPNLLKTQNGSARSPGSRRRSIPVPQAQLGFAGNPPCRETPAVGTTGVKWIPPFPQGIRRRSVRASALDCNIRRSHAFAFCLSESEACPDPRGENNQQQSRDDCANESAVPSEHSHDDFGDRVGGQSCQDGQHRFVRRQFARGHE